MGWQVYFLQSQNRWAGYGVPAICDHPQCSAPIDRGVAYLCGTLPGQDEDGCGLYFCDKHGSGGRKSCTRCRNYRPAFQPKPDTPEWIEHMHTDESWAAWRRDNGVPEPSTATVRN